MGPYYRGTSQGMGAFFNLFYEHPLLILLFAAAAAGTGIYFWRRKKSEENTRL
jgi:LPXTG-motif cell wall-anchored protein